ncbi:hypothetical protein Tco_0918248 [Tanacetum coccineum]
MGNGKNDSMSTTHATAEIGCYLQGNSYRIKRNIIMQTLARSHDDLQSTSGGLQFLGEKLVSWSSKKQDCTALSTTEAEYDHIHLLAQVHLNITVVDRFNKAPSKGTL